MTEDFSAGLDPMPAGSWAGTILACPFYVPFLPALAAAILDGSIWWQGTPEPHELAELTVYLPTREAAGLLKLALLAQSSNGATFLPRIRVLGEADPLDLFASYGTRMVSPAAALDLLKQALAVPEAFDGLERHVWLAALAMEASKSLHGARLVHEPLFTLLSASSAFTVAGQIAALIGEAQAEGAELSRLSGLDSSRASGSEQLSLQLLRAVLRGWQAHKTKTGKIDSEERRNRLMAVEAEFLRQSKTPVIVAAPAACAAMAAMQLIEAALSRPRSALVLHGTVNGNISKKNHPEHPEHGLSLLLDRLYPSGVSIPSPAPSKCPPAREGVGGEKKEARARFWTEALCPAPATAGWAHYIETIRSEPGSTAPGLSLIEADTVQDEVAVIVLILRECLETPGQTAALVTCSESLTSRVRAALVPWGLTPGTDAPVSSPDNLAARAVSCAASGKPEDLVELLRQAQGKDAACLWRVAETADLGALRQMWRPASFAGLPAALARAEDAIASGKARHPAMTRIAPGEWDAARNLVSQTIEALAPLTQYADKQAALPDWLVAHRLALLSLKNWAFWAPEALHWPRWNRQAHTPSRSISRNMRNFSRR